MDRREFLRLVAAAPLAAVAACTTSSEPQVSSPPPSSPSPSPGAPGSPEAAPATLEWFPFRERGPGPRRDHSLTPADGTLYLFGGRAGGEALDELWTWQPATGWRRVNATGPAPRFGHNAAFVRGRLLVFGGQGGAGLFFDDLWEWNPGNERWKRISRGGPAPAARYGAGGTAVGSALTISHGFTDAGRFDDTWSFRGRWRDVTPAGPRPVERCLHRLVHLEALGLLVLFGGQTTGTPFLGDTWVLDAGMGGWTELGGRGPAPRSFYAAVAAGDVMYLFGGSGEEGDLNDLWSFDGARWRREEPAGDPPGPRNGHDMALLDGRVMLFGGAGEDGELDELWELTLPSPG